MSVQEQAETVRAAVAPLVDALGFELYDVELLGHGAARTLRVSITGPNGVDLDAITATTHAISPLLDVGVTIAPQSVNRSPPSTTPMPALGG